MLENSQRTVESAGIDLDASPICAIDSSRRRPRTGPPPEAEGFLWRQGFLRPEQSLDVDLKPLKGNQNTIVVIAVLDHGGAVEDCADYHFDRAVEDADLTADRLL
jgi:hypothetical protein